MVILGNLRVRMVANMGNGLLVLMAIGCALAALFVGNRLGGLIKAVADDNVASLVQLDTISGEVSALRLAGAKQQAMADPAGQDEQKRQFDAHVATTRQAIDGYRKLVSDDEDRRIFGEFERLFDEYVELGARSVAERRSDPKASYELWRTKLAELGPKMDKALDQDIAHNEHLAVSAGDAGKSAAAVGDRPGGIRGGRS